MSTINLLPDDYLRKRAQRRANMLCFVLFVVVMGGIMGAAYVLERSSQQREEVRERVNADYRNAARMIEKMHQLQNQKASMIRKAEDTARLTERVPRSYLLGLVTQCLPKDVSLTLFDLKTIEFKEPKLAVRSVKQKRSKKFDRVADQRSSKAPELAVEITIGGRAATDVEVARFLHALDKHPIVERADLVFSVEPKKSGCRLREFEVLVRLRRHVDVLDTLGEAGGEATAAQPSGPSRAPGGLGLAGIFTGAER
jgi:hypothetical protein